MFTDPLEERKYSTKVFNQHDVIKVPFRKVPDRAARIWRDVRGGPTKGSSNLALCLAADLS